MSIVTKFTNLGPSSVVDERVHDIVTYIHKQWGEGGGGKNVGGRKM